MNHERIIEFGCSTMSYQILQILEDIIHLGRPPRWITTSSVNVSIILHILLILIQ